MVTLFAFVPEYLSPRVASPPRPPLTGISTGQPSHSFERLVPYIPGRDRSSIVTRYFPTMDGAVLRRRNSTTTGTGAVGTSDHTDRPGTATPPPPPPLQVHIFQSSNHRRYSSSIESNWVRRGGRVRLWLVVLGVVAPFVPWIYHSSQTHQIRSLQSEIRHLLHDQRRVHSELERATANLREASEKSRVLEHESADLLVELAEWGSSHGGGEGEGGSSNDHNVLHSNAYHRAEQQEGVHLDRIDHLHVTIQDKSRQHAQHTWGKDYQNVQTGTFRINVTLTREPLPGTGQWFVVETAPLRLLPHAVDHFLRLVQRQVWDGLSLLHQTVTPPAPSASVSDTALLPPPSNRIHTAEVSAQTNQFVHGHYETVRQSKSETRPRFMTELAFAEHSTDYQLQQYSGASGWVRSSALDASV